ncbi:MMPL family RND transporter, partial [Mycobacteroides abscessus subsp. massiliense]
LSRTVASMERMYSLMQELTGTMHSMVGRTHEMEATIQEMRDNLANFDDFFRPLRNYFYWEKHCFDIPICQSLRSIFDVLDSVDVLADQMHGLIADMDHMDQLMPQMLPVLR